MRDLPRPPGFPSSSSNQRRVPAKPSIEFPFRRHKAVATRATFSVSPILRRWLRDGGGWRNSETAVAASRAGQPTAISSVLSGVFGGFFLSDLSYGDRQSKYDWPPQRLRIPFPFLQWHERARGGR
nr:hypothetical protein Itr_chr03CG07700 [Ipomoea trifida]